MPLLDFLDTEAIGSVFGVDTTSVTLVVENVEQLRRLQVNHLVVLRSSNAGQHLIGLITKILRRVLADSPDDKDANAVERDAANVKNVVRVALIGTLVDRVGLTENVFRRTLESVPEIDAKCFVLDGDRLTRFMRAISRTALDGRPALSVGTYTLDKNAEAWLDGNRFFQRHAIIVGSTGSGKSWTVARFIEQIALLPKANAIVFDIHGEYKPLAGEGVTCFRIAGPSDIGTGRGLDDGVIHLPYWLLTYEEILALLLDRSDSNAPNQAMVFSRAVLDAKTAPLDPVKHKSVLANFTVDSPVPFRIEDVINQLKTLDEEMVTGVRGDKQGPFNGKLTRFVQRLQAKVQDRRLGFLFDPSPALLDYEWMPRLVATLLGAGDAGGRHGVKILDFSEVPSDILPLIAGLVARVVFTVQAWTAAANRHPIALFCDEAHLYVPEQDGGGAVAEAGLRSFERIAKEGRKYGTALVVISQRPAEVNHTVLSQCNNFVVMRLTNAEDQGVIRKLLPDSLGGFAELLPVLDVGEALVVGDSSLLPSRIRVSTPTRKPASATVAVWDCWSDGSAKQDIPTAVESLRRQSST